jgi:hypothetical protein
MTTDAGRDLLFLLAASRAGDIRKRRLLACALVRHVLKVIPVGPIHNAVQASVEFGEQWADEDAEEEGMDERSRLIRAYDRRQLRNPVFEMIRILFHSEQITEHYAHSAAYWTLRAADAPLWDSGELQGSVFFDFIRSARQAAVCHDHCKYDPSWQDARVTAFAEERETERQIAIAIDIFGDRHLLVPVDPPWLSETAVQIAKGMYDSRDFSAMPILADALQDAGCDNDDVLNHCREANGVHVRGCWVVDLVLGKS